MTTEELDDTTRVVLENDSYLLVEVLTLDSAKYYAKEFYDFSLSYWASSFRDYYNFVLVDKKNRLNSVVMIIKSNDRYDIETLDGEELGIIELIKRYPFLTEFLLEYINPFSVSPYFGLKLFAGNKLPNYITNVEHQISNMDELIYKVDIANKNPKNTLITIQFDSDEHYFKTFGFNDDTVWFLNILFNSYGNGYDFVDYYDTYEWEEGRLLYNLNENNLNKLNEILKLILPGVQLDNQTFQDDDLLKQITSSLDNFYPKLGERMMDEHSFYENISRNEAAKKEITEDLCRIYEKNNIFLVKNFCFYRYIVPVWVILKLYERFGNYNMDLYGLISSLGHTKDVPEYGEYIYEFYGDFDSDAFNSSVESTIDDMLEYVMDSDEFLNITEYSNILDEISKKYQLKRWYDFPSDSDKSFNIEGVNPVNNKLIVLFKMGHADGSGRTEISLDDFYNKITNLSLF